MCDLTIFCPPSLQVPTCSDSTGDLKVPVFIKKSMEINEEFIVLSYRKHVILWPYEIEDRAYNIWFQRAIWSLQAEGVAGGRGGAERSAHTPLKGTPPTTSSFIAFFPKSEIVTLVYMIWWEEKMLKFIKISTPDSNLVFTYVPM